jgi:hypothetical protein
MVIRAELGVKLAESKSIQRVFGIMYKLGENASSEDRRKLTDRNLVKELLDKEQVTKLCCRNTILT